MRAKMLVVVAAVSLGACKRPEPKPAVRPKEARAAEGREKKKPMDEQPGPLDYVGTARNAKGGAVLLLEKGRIVVYIAGRDSWDEKQEGTLVVVRGHLVFKEHLPVATKDEHGGWTQGVDPRHPRQWVLVDAEVVDKAASPRVLPLAMMESAVPGHRKCLKSIAAGLRKKGEDPSEFHVSAGEIEQKGELRFHLWHRSAFTPTNRRMMGNPGGKCRDAICDEDTGELKRFLWWQ
jgi:hypothetical protein